MIGHGTTKAYVHCCVRIRYSGPEV
jgi:hypothetical protein